MLNLSKANQSNYFFLCAYSLTFRHAFSVGASPCGCPRKEPEKNKNRKKSFTNQISHISLSFFSPLGAPTRDAPTSY